MKTIPKLPAWTGDMEEDCTLTVGNLMGRAECLEPVTVQKGDGERWHVDYWYCAVCRIDGSGKVVSEVYQSAAAEGAIIRGDMARAICERIIREAMRADEAEKLATELYEVIAEASPVISKLAEIARGMASEKKWAYDTTTPPIEDVIEELAAEAPPEDWAKLGRERERRSIADVVAAAMTGQTDWDSFRSFAATIPDEDWAKLLAARDEEESG